MIPDLSVIPDTAIRNEAGQVAMKYRRLLPQRVRCGGHPNYKTYIFTIRANIPMTWVDEDHVGCMANVSWGCCGKTKRGGVLFCNEADVRQWTNGGGR